MSTLDDDDNTDHRSKEEEQGIGDSFVPVDSSSIQCPGADSCYKASLLLSAVDYDDDDDKLDDQIKVGPCVFLCVRRFDVSVRIY
jgi:hypothetical protein